MKERNERSRSDLVVAGCFLLFGAFLTISSLGLPAGSGGYPGAGFFPRALGIVVLALSVFLVVQALAGRATARFRVEHVRVVAGVAALTLLYLLLWGTGIFALRTFIFVTLLLRFLGQPWRTGLAVSAVLTGVVTMAFQFGLNLSLE